MRTACIADLATEAASIGIARFLFDMMHTSQKWTSFAALGEFAILVVCRVRDAGIGVFALPGSVPFVEHGLCAGQHTNGDSSYPVVLLPCLLRQVGS